MAVEKSTCGGIGSKALDCWLQYGHIDIEYQLRSRFGVFSHIGTFSCGCGVGKTAARGHNTCSLERDLEHVPACFNLRIRHYLLFLGLGLGLKGVTPSAFKFYEALYVY